MDQKQYILAHDLGTTGNKATLFDADTGEAVSSIFEAYNTTYPHPNWAEQSPSQWWRAIRDSTRGLLATSHIEPGKIAVISFSGMMMGILSVDREGNPIYSAIIWADQRAVAEAGYLIQNLGMEAVYRRTGHRAGASYSAAKMLWMKNHQPELYARTAKFLQAKDFAAFQLCGVFATDYSDASGTNLFDLDKRTWAKDMISSVGLDLDKLPPAYPSNTVIGSVTDKAAAETGLLAGTPVVIGGGDGACATVGAGSVQPGDAYNYIGSSSWIAVSSEQPFFDPYMKTVTFCHLDPNLYFPIGVMQSAGGSFDWLERLLRGEGQEKIYEELLEAAASVEPHRGELIFLPYLLGERSPYWNPLARGSFIGLSMSHDRGEMTRAVLEGVGFNLKIILKAFQDQGTDIREIRLIGGGARSSIWRQILADIYELPILKPNLLSEATSLGAAIAGGVGVGIYPDYQITRKFVQVEACEKPNPNNLKRYRELYRLFQQAYTALEPIFDELAKLSS